MEGIQYCGIASVLWGITAENVGDSFNTVENIFSAVEAVQYSRGITSVQWEGGGGGGVASVPWKVFSTVGERLIISACLAIKNDEKISIFFCITKQRFHSEVSKILADFMPF